MFKFTCREQTRNQALPNEPGGCAAYAVFTAQRLGFFDGRKSGPIQQSGMESVEIDCQFRRVPINDSAVSEVLAGNKVGRKESFLKRREHVRLIPPDPL